MNYFGDRSAGMNSFLRQNYERKKGGGGGGWLRDEEAVIEQQENRGHHTVRERDPWMLSFGHRSVEEQKEKVWTWDRVKLASLQERTQIQEVEV